MIKNILFIIPPKVHLLDVNGPAHIFYEALEYGAKIDLKFVSLNEKQEVESSAGLSFSKLEPFHQYELRDQDYIFIPGIHYKLLSDPDFIKKAHPFLEWLKVQHANGAKICSVCTGAFLLAESGILNGKSCTTHWKYCSIFQNRFPHIDLLTNRLFVIHNNVYSSAGVSAGIDLSLYILEDQFGTKFATDIAKEVVVYLRRSESDPQLSVFLQYRNHLDTRIHDAQDFMTQNIYTTLTIEDIADRVNMSPRNLTRRFKEITGITIGAYVEKLRVERAVHLLSEGNKVDFVAGECGLKSSNQLRSLLKKHHSVLPTEISSLT